MRRLRRGNKPRRKSVGAGRCAPFRSLSASKAAAILSFRANNLHTRLSLVIASPFYFSGLRVGTEDAPSIRETEEDMMRSARRGADWCLWILLLASTLLLTPTVYAGNQVMGEIQFEGKSKVEKTSGVWVDGGYVGYLKELKGSKKVLLLPGEHVITVRQNGYQDFTERVAIQPGDKKLVMVIMSKAPTGLMPAVLSQVKIAVNPSRAAVFLDDRFVGHVGEFEGVGRGLLIAPGEHRIRI